VGVRVPLSASGPVAIHPAYAFPPTTRGLLQLPDERTRQRVGRPGRLPFRHYEQLDLQLDQHKTLWCYMRPDGPPSYTRGMLSDLADMQRGIKRLFAESAGDPQPPIRHFVLASHIPGIFNLGGDLRFFAHCIRTGDRDSLANYAHACIEVLYNNFIAFDLPVVTVALVQGDALGGGFESALACDVIVAERSAKFGLPEILFNLFPGMGAYSLLSRRLDAARAERMILGGQIYGAEELQQMGLVDVIAEDGEGEQALRDYLARNVRRHAVHRSVYGVRRRINPLTFDELQDVTRIWVDAALRLEDADLRRMERLMTAQLRRLTATAASRTDVPAGA
jgi:DSF synthase